MALVEAVVEEERVRCEEEEHSFFFCFNGNNGDFRTRTAK